VDSGKIALITGDGRLGHPPGAPYDAIHVGAAASGLPQPVKRIIKNLQKYLARGSTGGGRANAYSSI